MSKAFDKVCHKGRNLSHLGFQILCYVRVLLNGQTSEWVPVKAGVPQGSILGPFFFFFYINDLSDKLLSTVNPFADDIKFSVVNDNNISADELSKDLQKISEWAYKWKMSFNPDLNKQAQEVVSSRKLNKSSHPEIFFDNTPIVCASWQKPLGKFLDESLNFSYHIKKKCPKH